MVRPKNKRIIKSLETNKIITTKAPIARGHIKYIEEDKFVLTSSVKRFKEGKSRLEDMTCIVKRNEKDYSYFQEAYVPLNTPIKVIMKYKDKKSKEGNYSTPEDNLPIEIISLSGRTIYQKSIID